MSSDTAERRRLLARELLIQLKNIKDHLQALSDDLGDSSGSFLSKVYEDHYEKIREKINVFNKNVERVKELNLEITATFNDWYLFTKNDKELKSPLFPIRLFLKRKKMQAKTRELKQEITSIGIKNRLVRDDIQRLESTLEYEATVRLKKDVRYEDYVSHLKTKSQLIEELQYLLPTLPGFPVTEIHMGRLEEAIQNLN